ncbi:UDP-N-acetylmuramoyl-L-alanine--D-glutamate ligase [Thioalkalicoccus limnaeus]|uniref:UDP-N-acetylmuramoylalanine--D-glutamate ligase n=1 Tax=Thioalkalicoccus limnaeus TaxID=120681 RepID=A0ABV4BC45_9GAMM
MMAGTWHKSPLARTLVVGLGRTGLSCARFLRAQGVPVAVTDSRAVPPGLDQLRAELPDVALFLDGFREEVFAVADGLVVSPGVPVAEPLIQAAMARGVPVVGDIELFALAARAPVVAITGSNGKSTVTTLVGQMAARAGVRVAVGGNLGEPALDLLDDRVELYVLELSSFQLETTYSLRARAAVVLNLSSDHMDRYPDLAAYGAAKARIFHGAEIAIINLDDPLVRVMPTGSAERRGFTMGVPDPDAFGLLDQGGETWLARGGMPWLRADELRIPGRHNQANALAALALGQAAGLPREAMCEALRHFGGLPHRSALVAERAGCRWYDDSKGTNPGATVAALEGLVPPGSRHRAVLIAGGDGKGADFGPLAAAIVRTSRAVVLLGRDAPRIAAALNGSLPVGQAGDMDDAVRQAAAFAQPDDCVLLSPACASLDMFENYEHRGRVFAEAVRRLPR